MTKLLTACLVLLMIGTSVFAATTTLSYTQLSKQYLQAAKAQRSAFLNTPTKAASTTPTLNETSGNNSATTTPATTFNIKRAPQKTQCDCYANSSANNNPLNFIYKQRLNGTKYRFERKSPPCRCRLHREPRIIDQIQPIAAAPTTSPASSPSSTPQKNNDFGITYN